MDNQIHEHRKITQLFTQNFCVHKIYSHKIRDLLDFITEIIANNFLRTYCVYTPYFNILYRFVITCYTYHDLPTILFYSSVYVINFKQLNTQL